MKTVSDELRALLGSGGYHAELVADVYYNDEPTLKGLQVTGWTVQQDLEAQIKIGGSLTVAYNGDFGDSPSTELLGPLSPYGQELNLTLKVTTGGFTETIDVGRFRITAVPKAHDAYAILASGAAYVVSSTGEITFEDLLVLPARAGLRGPQPPINLDSTWAEMQRLSGLPVLRSLPDQPTPQGVVYEPKQGGRLDAIQGLASWLGGVAVITSDGELTVIPFQPGDIAATVRYGPGRTADDGGTVLDLETGMESDQLYNEVIGIYQADDGTPWDGYAAITEGPLAVDGPYGPYTYFDTWQGVQTQAQADKRAADVLARLRLAQAHQVAIPILPRPDLELGDVIEVLLPVGGPIVGRIIAQTLTGTTGNGAVVSHTVTLDMAGNVYL